MNIEPLESRIAPASVLLYTDLDGDKVKVTSSSAGGDLNTAATFSDLDTAAPRQLQKLTLGGAFTGTNLTFTVTKVPGGDGLAHVGNIEAINVDLGNVTVKGDLGQITCGNGNPNDDFPAALKTLKVASMGRFGLATQGGVGDLQSDFNGTLNSLQVTGDIVGAFVNVIDDADLLAAKVGGFIIGGLQLDAGSIYAEGNLGAVTVGRDVIGGTAGYTGAIGAGIDVKSITVGGSVVGGSGANSGHLHAGFAGAGNMGPVKIGRDLVGGSQGNAGSIFADGRRDARADRPGQLAPAADDRTTHRDAGNLSGVRPQGHGAGFQRAATDQVALDLHRPHVGIRPKGGVEVAAIGRRAAEDRATDRE